MTNIISPTDLATTNKRSDLANFGSIRGGRIGVAMRNSATKGSSPQGRRAR